MGMFCLKLRPETAFGSKLLGETLFGQLCWAILRRQGKERLEQLLDGYCDGRPFAVVSDAFPSGYVPLPTLPAFCWESHDESQRKYLKKKAWLPVELLREKPSKWRDWAATDAELVTKMTGSDRGVLKQEAVEVHNTINRRTQTTGTGMFAPYMQNRTWLHPEILLTLYVVLDEERFTKDELVQTLTDIGLSGFGRDASTGLGKFTIVGEPGAVSVANDTKAYVTLASCVLSAVPDVDSSKTFYRVRTHFGRHGEAMAVSGQPFKSPLLLAGTGALVALKEPKRAEFFGKGITGISVVAPETVHQGYAPVLPAADFQ